MLEYAQAWDIPGAPEYTVEDYIWLGEHPVGAVLTKVSSDWSSVKDDPTSAGNCGAGAGLATPLCGLRHLVSDYQDRPVLAMDDFGRIAGVGEYDAWGTRNLRRIAGQVGVTASGTYAPNQNNDFLTWSAQPVKLYTSSRLSIDVLDLEPDYDYLNWKLPNGTGIASFTGQYPARKTNWFLGRGGTLNFQSGATSDCVPHYSPLFGSWCTPSSGTNWPYKGVATAAVEFERYDNGANPYFPKLRNSGQFEDEETGFYANSNRFYDGTVGLPATSLLSPCCRTPTLYLR